MRGNRHWGAPDLDLIAPKSKMQLSWASWRARLEGNPFEHDVTRPDLFRAACNMGLEGLV
jgi:hypothetical protein